MNSVATGSELYDPAVVNAIFGAWFAPIPMQRQVGRSGGPLSAFGRRNVRHKLLKTKRLNVFQLRAELSIFATGIPVAKKGNTLTEPLHNSPLPGWHGEERDGI